MRKQDKLLLDKRITELDNLYAQLGPILENLLSHKCSGKQKVTTCFWCWYYEFALEKIIKLEDRINRQVQRMYVLSREKL